MNCDQLPNKRYIEIQQSVRDQEMKLILARAAWQAQEKPNHSHKQAGIKAWIVLLQESLSALSLQLVSASPKKS